MKKLNKFQRKIKLLRYELRRENSILAFSAILIAIWWFLPK